MEELKIVAFDSTSDYLSLALSVGGEIIANKHIYEPRAHLAHLVPAIAKLLKSVDLSLQEIGLLAVGTGPGSFTGTRIGVATAKSLAQGSGKPLVGIASLDILAAGLEARPQQLVYPIVDANRRQVYTAAYRGDNRISPYDIVTVDKLAETLARENNDLLATGNGLALYGKFLMDKLGDKFIPAVEDKWYPNAKYLIKIAEKKFSREQATNNDYYKINPIYLRLSDAEERLKRQSHP